MTTRPRPPSSAGDGALVLLLLAPVAVLPLALDRFPLPKAACLAAGCAAAFLAPARGRLPRAATVLGALAALVLIGAALLGAAPLAAILGRMPRYEGGFVLAVYAGCTVAGARLLGVADERRTRLVVRLLAAAAIAVAALALLEAAGLRPLESNVDRPGSLLGNASDQGAWALLALGPLAVVALRRRDVWAVAGSVAAVATLVTSASRGAFIGAALLAAVLAVAVLRRRERLALAGVLVLAAALALALPATRTRVLATDGVAGGTASGRGLLWSETLDLVADHPVAGVGPSGFVDAIPVEHDEQWQRRVGPLAPPDSPHSWPLQALVAGGPLLLGLTLALAALVVRAAMRRIRTGDVLAAGLLAGLAGCAVALLFHFTSPGPTGLAALFAGALLAAPPFPRPVAGEDGRRWSGTACWPWS